MNFFGRTIAFTGHRLDKVGAFECAVKLHMLTMLMTFKPNKVISGMAVGIDTWAAQCTLALGIPLVAAVPFDGQHLHWPEGARRTYTDILLKAAEVRIVCDGGYHPSKMQARNEWMVDHCGLLLAYFNGSLGGTQNCLRYAERVGRDRLVVDPTRL